MDSWSVFAANHPYLPGLVASYQIVPFVRELIREVLKLNGVFREVVQFPVVAVSAFHDLPGLGEGGLFAQVFPAQDVVGREAAA